MRFRRPSSLLVSCLTVSLAVVWACSDSKPSVDPEPEPGANPEGGASLPGQDGGGQTNNPGTDGSTSNLPLPAGSYALAERVEQARYVADITTVAQPRLPGSPHWQTIQDLCASRFAEYGFAVERQNYGTGVNVIGVRTGTTEPTKRVILGAHYDAVKDCPGADDNASGVAGVLESARVLSMVSYPKTLVVACWDEEERGLLGSKAQAKAAADAKDVIDAVFDFEMIAYKSDEENTQNMPTGFGIFFPEAVKFVDGNKKRANFIGAGGDPKSSASIDALKAHADKAGLPFMSLKLSSGDINNPLLADLQRSDHAAFWGKGYPGIMITDTSNFRYDGYHCLNSKVDELARLDMAFATASTRMVVGATAEALGFPRDF